MTATFTIHGIPRTKKNSGRIVMCGKFPKILPSKAYEVWHREAMKQAPLVLREFTRAGVPVPVIQPVNVRATIYRDRDVGDACGFYQAIGDWLEDAGILANDRLIESWDGSRRAKDAKRPRVEIEIRSV